MAHQTHFLASLKELREEGHRMARSHLHRLSDLDASQARALREVLMELPAEARRALLSAMVESAEEDFELDFEAAARIVLDDPDGEVRRLGIEALWESKDPRLAECFLRMLREDPEQEVRAQAAIGLGVFVMLHDFEEIPAELGTRIEETLISVARGSEPLEVRRRAVESMGFSSRAEVADLIAASYTEADPGMKCSALLAMGRSADDEAWGKTVRGELRNPAPSIRFEAARAAGSLALRGAVPDLVELLSDADMEVREQAIWALGEIGGQVARRALERARRAATEEERTLISDALDNLEFQSGLGDFGLLGLGAGDKTLN